MIDLNRLKLLKPVHLAMFFILGSTAACGMLYEYMLSSYSANVLGAQIKVILMIILLMILSMGAGAAIIPRYVKNYFNAFATIEALITIVGSLSVVLISISHGVGYILPDLLASIYNSTLGPMNGGTLSSITAFMDIVPYVVAIIIGLLVGAEIPLMAEIRQTVSDKKLQNNVGMMYGIDYLGAFIGGTTWVYLMHSIEISLSATLIASVNLIIGLIFIAIFKKYITIPKTLIVCNSLALLSILMVYNFGFDIARWSEQLLYKDKIVFEHTTPYQRIVLTKREFDKEEPEFRFYINGNTQFSSSDEKMYHGMLVSPAMLASDSTSRVLVVGGGDGLALRNILTWEPKEVTLLDLDPDLINFFKSPWVKDGRVVNEDLLKLNNYAFQDPRVDVILGDAFVSANNLIRNDKKFDVIIIDLPDPSHPDLAKLYSTVFYDKINHLLSEGGAVVVQSTSPYNAYETFLCIKKTLVAGGFASASQYHTFIPSFGEWGFTIARKDNSVVKDKIKEMSSIYPDDQYTTKDLILSSFDFGKGFYSRYDDIKINYNDSVVVYQYHEKNWRTLSGTFRTN